jgi:hypothetical protein
VGKAFFERASPIFLYCLAGIIDLFRFLLRVQVIEVAEPLVEAVNRRQELIAVTEMGFIFLFPYSSMTRN